MGSSVEHWQQNVFSEVCGLCARLCARVLVGG